MVKTDHYSGLQPPCTQVSSLDHHLFERYPSLLVAVLATFFEEATEMFNSLMIFEEEAYKEGITPTFSFSLVAIILASMESFLPELLTSY